MDTLKIYMGRAAENVQDETSRPLGSLEIQKQKHKLFCWTPCKIIFLLQTAWILTKAEHLNMFQTTNHLKILDWGGQHLAKPD